MATSRGFGQFSRRMEFRANELDKSVDRTVRKTALVIDQAVVFSTAVDKGVARSNWRVSLSTPATGTISAYAPGNKLGLGEVSNAQAAISQGLAVIASRQPGQSIVIANNVPYIESLNAGSSLQSPAGFIETAISQSVAAVSQAKIFPSP